MNVLVTGGAGYIGSVLVRDLLSRGYRVRVVDKLLYGGASLFPILDHHSFDFIKGDLRSPEIISRSLEGIDAVVHLAAVVGDPASKRFPKETKEINYEATLSLIDQSLRHNVNRFVFISTCSNYGATEDPDSYVNEEAPLRPLSIYAQTKVDVEKHLLENLQSCPMDWTILRFATAHGLSPRMRFDLTVNEFSYILAKGETLEVYGEQFWRPYCHVLDFSKCIITILESPEDKIHYQVFNVGTESENYRKGQILEIIRKYLPQLKIKMVQQLEDPRNYRVSFEKIRRSVGFKPDYQVRDSVRNIIFAYNNHIIRNGGEILNSNIDSRVNIKGI